MTALVVALSGGSVAVLPSAASASAPARGTASAPTPAKPGRKPAPILFYAVKLANTQPSPLKVGDSWVSYQSLFDGKRRRAGDASAHCAAVQVTPRGTVAQCARVLRTKRGQITLLGLESVPGAVPLTGVSTVTGGTGHYTGLTGAARVTDGPRHVVYRITPAG
ncbi:allene oxide cyclase barrel-like domain-containing protein [Sphaerisporangium aureirubrum]|uniref:Allene oxide cyclase barrel-like domain-containing protein n=1 Tax=Sphaerisporangium aureirubrum TaxID=1544736 RepID=A0ABW1NST4_9ACTN